MRTLLSVVLLVGCRGSDPTPAVDAADVSADVGIDADPDDKAANCASTFGAALTDAFGRLDGTVLAVVPPGHPTCAMPNSSHVVVQVTMNGAAYRMVVNVRSTSSDTRVYTHGVDAPLVGEAWAEGWHAGTQLDYVSTLAVASTAFVPHDMPETTAFVTDPIEVGAKISVYATSSGGTRAESAHLVHRNEMNADGAIVVNPETAPHYLLFRFGNQTF